MWHIYMMEYYLAIGSNEVQIYTVTWMNPENLRLSKRSQSQTVTYYMISFI